MRLLLTIRSCRAFRGYSFSLIGQPWIRSQLLLFSCFLLARDARAPNDGATGSRRGVRAQTETRSSNQGYVSSGGRTEREIGKERSRRRRAGSTNLLLASFRGGQRSLPVSFNTVLCKYACDHTDRQDRLLIRHCESSQGYHAVLCKSLAVLCIFSRKRHSVPFFTELRPLPTISSAR